ncbi:MAG: Rieske 2Fe-2S domain-containing protein, partial [Proteobacteria bacterium]|nr:Rieske 2Fe-2S domain-containing protein [Pseudomonadota bacterium]
SLCTGRLDGHLVQCPAHGLRFDVRTGAMPGNPALRTTTYPVLACDGGHALELPDAAG